MSTTKRKIWCRLRRIIAGFLAFAVLFYGNGSNIAFALENVIPEMESGGSGVPDLDVATPADCEEPAAAPEFQEEPAAAPEFQEKPAAGLELQEGNAAAPEFHEEPVATPANCEKYEGTPADSKKYGHAAVSCKILIDSEEQLWLIGSDEPVDADHIQLVDEDDGDSGPDQGKMADEGVLKKDDVRIASDADAVMADAEKPETETSETQMDETGISDAEISDSVPGSLYSLDAVYVLTRDIPLSQPVWQVPDGFTGRFEAGEPRTSGDVVYDSETDTIFLYNRYQLQLAGTEEGKDVPVTDSDDRLGRFGEGEKIPVNPDAVPAEEEADSTGDYLTYDDTHSYVLASSFSAKGPDINFLAADSGLLEPEGRDAAGQRTVTVGGRDYILIGDRQQLKALDSYSTGENKEIPVTGPIWKLTYARLVKGQLLSHTMTLVSAELVYPGDADLIDDLPVKTYTYGNYETDANGNVTKVTKFASPKVETVTKNFGDTPLYGADGFLRNEPKRHGATDIWTELAGEKETKLGESYSQHSHISSVDIGIKYVGGTLEKFDEKTAKYDEGSYDTSKNFIIFRDIDLKSEEWYPLMFNGTMYGAKAEGTGTLWDQEKTQLNVDTSNPAVISNIQVVPKLTDGKLEITQNIGVGFFGTISAQYDDSLNSQKTVVQNLRLKDGTVDNPATDCHVEQTLLNGLTTFLGGLLGGLLDVLLGILTVGQVKLDLSAILSSLLDARKADPSSLATGGFAGCIMGKAEVTDCSVEDFAITTVSTSFEKNNKIVGKGGFVGYVEGATHYDGLSKLAKDLLKALANLLNVIPGLGVGDLITILGQTLKLGELIPVGYDSPVIRACTADNAVLSEESGKRGVGGFAGSASGVTLESCMVTGSSLTVTAEKYGGGFVGVLRDAQIEQLLSGLKVELLPNILPGLQPQSEMLGCEVQTANLTVKGGSCLGGLAGILANSYAINCGTAPSSKITVDASGNHAGGVAGLATVGSMLGELGESIGKNPDLLSTVSGLLEGVLSGDTNQALLSLVGVSPSAVMGCRVEGPLNVRAGGDYAGGIVGQADGAYITQSSEENLNKLIKYRMEKQYPLVDPRRNTVSSLKRVTALNCAGGAAGLLTTANVAGLLDSTLGVASYIGFHLSETDITGADGYAVETIGNYAGGGAGMALGGDISDVQLTGLGAVNAVNYAGGFAGCTGPGSLVSDSGLDVELLGLHLLKADNLLQVVDGMRTTYRNANVTGIESGFTIQATGKDGAVTEYAAGGFIGKASSVEIAECVVRNLLSVSADLKQGAAGGFVGVSTAGGLAETGKEENLLGEGGLLDIGNLLSAAPYLIPYFNACHVYYVDGGFVSADTAGGFTGDFQSGKVNTESLAESAPETGSESTWYAVHNIDHVTGVDYAGGFGGKVYSGALVSGGGGLNLLGVLNLKINANDLLGLVNAYVPVIKYAGVQSCDNGLMVKAMPVEENPSQDGRAGGYIGYGSGVSISYCDVTSLRNTVVTPPGDLESRSAVSYFNEESEYAVTGAAYAGGYIGHMNIGSAATAGSDGSNGGGLSVLGDTLNLKDIAGVLDVVVSTIEHSDVTGLPGGFSVLADGTAEEGTIGRAGGFAGAIEGGHIQDSNSYNFAYIIGQIAAGGYVGDLKPGDAAEILGGAKILGGVAEIQGSLLTALEDFVPTIRNSETTCIPCGGAVRAQAASDSLTLRGMAGGYCGHNEGGHIWGNHTGDWKAATYEGPVRECGAVRILSVYGEEYAGGFTGLMQSADTVQTGGLSALFGLIRVDNPIGALSIVYPTEENTAVYGPLAKLDRDTWESWVKWVGQYGGYGSGLASSSYDNLSDYEYGYHAAAGRAEYDSTTNLADGGCAGGYVGAMHSGVITNGQAKNAKMVRGLRAAGGFAGEMLTGGATSLGSLEVAGIKLEPGQTVSALETLVPVAKNSSVTAYQSGLTVIADPDGKYHAGTDITSVGYAGGYVGYASGAQIWGDVDDKPGCNVKGLLKVSGTNAIGGFAGLATAASVADVDTSETSDGVIQGLLNSLIDANKLLNVLKATLTTIRQVSVTPSDPEFGFVVDGQYGENRYADYAGGFAGLLEAAVVGKEKMEGGVTTADPEIQQTVDGLRGVIGGHYAGGFFGMADTGNVAEIGGKDADGDKTNLLMKLLELGNVSALDAFRTYVYSSTVRGVEEGCVVKAVESAQYGTQTEVRFNGDAGGFGGALLNGSVKGSHVENLSAVEGPGYVGGFIGHMDKGGVADVSGLDAAKLLDIGANALNIFGSHTEDCSAAGISRGFIVKSANESADESSGQPVAGGFVGFADLARLKGNTVTELKHVTSTQIAGGFVGRMERTYLVNAEADSELVQILFLIVDGLLQGLGVTELEKHLSVAINLGIVKIGAGDGNLVQVYLLGLPITVTLADGDSVAKVQIGNSVIELAVTRDENGNLIVSRDEENSNVVIHLIKANRTEIENCSVTGISIGYDVSGGVVGETVGADKNGYAGGFVGLNNEGKLTNNEMFLCDVVWGTDNQVGPFSGYSPYESAYEDFGDNVDSTEKENHYRIYRKLDRDITSIWTSNGDSFLNGKVNYSDPYNIYEILYRNQITDEFEELQGALEIGSKPVSGQSEITAKETGVEETAANEMEPYARSLDAYASPGKAVLMLDIYTPDIPSGLIPEPGDMLYPCEDQVDLTIQKVWNDLNDWDHIRPERIQVTILWARTDKDGNPVDRDGNPIEEPDWKSQPDGDENPLETLGDNPVSLSAKEDGSKWTSTWKKVLTGLPVGMERVNPDNQKEIVYYYTYSVQEVTVDGYKTSIQKSSAISAPGAAEHVFEITNSHTPKLPITGAAGGLGLVLFGAALICLGYELLFRTRKERRKAYRSQYLRR